MAKPKPVRAILIDPWTMTVEEVRHDARDYRNIYDALTRTESETNDGWPAMKVDTFTTAYGASGNVLAPGDALFVDDEGLLKGGPLRAFKFDGQPLVGRALVLGSDNQGETADAITPIERVEQAVEFGYSYEGE